MATPTFNFNTNTLLSLLRQHHHQPYLSSIHHSSLTFSLSLKPKTIFHHYALTPHSSSLPNSSSTSKHDHRPSPSTNTLNFKQTTTQTATGYPSLNSPKLQTATKNTRNFSTDRVKKKKGSENVVEKKSRNKKDHDSPEVKLRVALVMCSKKGDVLGALSLYDSAKSEGVKLGQHHYTVLLYLCSSAAVGVVRPAKSGTGARTLNALVSSSNETLNHEKSSGSTGGSNSDGTFDNAELNASVLDFIEKSEKKETNPFNQEDHGILVSEDVKKYALQKGFEVYENMCMDKVQMNEAALASVAIMAMSMGDGDMAFEMVKQMKILGISPRLRSYGPALSTFCNNGEVDKAFDLEKHMLEHGVYPEEPELEALLWVSIGAGKGDKVYYVLHKLRNSVRKVSPVTAYLIIDWFKSTQASRVGKRKWDKRLIKEAMENNGGGWHGQGWLGKGK